MFVVDRKGWGFRQAQPPSSVALLTCHPACRRAGGAVVTSSGLHSLTLEDSTDGGFRGHKFWSVVPAIYRGQCSAADRWRVRRNHQNYTRGHFDRHCPQYSAGTVRRSIHRLRRHSYSGSPAISNASCWGEGRREAVIPMDGGLLGNLLNPAQMNLTDGRLGLPMGFPFLLVRCQVWVGLSYVMVMSSRSTTS